MRYENRLKMGDNIFNDLHSCIQYSQHQKLKEKQKAKRITSKKNDTSISTRNKLN